MSSYSRPKGLGGNNERALNVNYLDERHCVEVRVLGVQREIPRQRGCRDPNVRGCRPLPPAPHVSNQFRKYRYDVRGDWQRLKHPLYRSQSARSKYSNVGINGHEHADF